MTTSTVNADQRPDAPKNDTSVKTRSQRGQWTIIIVLTIAVLFMAYNQITDKITSNVATTAAKDLAEPVNDLCLSDPSARRQIGEARCGQAAEIQKAPDQPIPTDGKNGTDGRNGENGKDGAAGRGIANTAVVDGHLFVTYTDGVREDKGIVASDGRNGRGITGARLDDGQLVLTYTDGTTEIVGRIVGRDGTDGRGVASVDINTSYHVLVTYTDGTVEDIGTLPAGPSGPPGRGVATLDINLDRCEVTIYYDDNTSETKPASGCTPKTEEPPPPDPTETTENGVLPTN